jgi:hypothetical protein
MILKAVDQHEIPIGTNEINIPAGTNAVIEFSQEIAHDDDISISGDSVATMPAPERVFVPPYQDVPVTPSAGISSRGRIRRMSQAMQDSFSQRSFYGNRGMHYMGNRATLSITEEAEEQYIRDHENHLSLQERMCHPIAFHAEMMG